MIYAVDFDGTLCIDGRPNERLIRFLQIRQRMGDTVILWTCRDGKRLTEAVAFLHNNGFVPNLVNVNSPAAIRMLGHDPRKVYADVYIDDKNIERLRSGTM